MAPNSPYWVIVFWACLLEGIIIVPLNIQSNSTIIDLIIKETEPKLFVGKNIELKTPSMTGIFVATAKTPFAPIPKNKVIKYLFAESTNHLLNILGMSGKEKIKLSFNK